MNSRSFLFWICVEEVLPWVSEWFDFASTFSGKWVHWFGGFCLIACRGGFRARLARALAQAPGPKKKFKGPKREKQVFLKVSLGKNEIHMLVEGPKWENNSLSHSLSSSRSISRSSLCGLRRHDLHLLPRPAPPSSPVVFFSQVPDTFRNRNSDPHPRSLSLWVSGLVGTS